MRGVIAHYRMDDDTGSSDVIDQTGNYNGTYKDKDGNIDTDTGASAAKIASGLDFDGPQADGGTDEYVDTGDTFQSTFQSSFSISIWVKPTDGQPAASGFLFGVSTVSEGDCVWMIITNTGALWFRYKSNTNRARLYLNSGAPMFSDGQENWHHLVMVVDSTIRGIGGIKGYFDGNLAPGGGFGTGDTTDVVSADFTSIYNPYIGAENAINTATLFYNGLIDNVIIYNRVLSPQEVYRQYHLYKTSRGRSRDRFRSTERNW